MNQIKIYKSSCQIQLLMKSNPRRNWSINHSLTPLPFQLPPSINQQPFESTPKKVFSPYKASKSVNPLTQRSRKHRLLEERNFEIQKTNRILYERIRKIKLKNMFQNQKKIESQNQDDSLHLIGNLAKNLLLPQINQIKHSTKSSTTISNRMLSMNSTKSYLDSILQDRGNFVEKYFIDLSDKKKNKQPEKELGVYLTDNGWKVQAILVEDKNLILVGKNTGRELTKKYLYAKVKDKMQNGLQEWVNFKFSFQT